MSTPESVANPYQKRLGLLAAGMILILAGLAARHAWLSLVHGASNRAAAMAALTDVTILPTIRGSILDARGEVLAEDRAPGLSVEMRYDLIDPEAWVHAESGRKARERIGGRAWRRLEPAARDAARDLARPEVAARRRSMLMAIARDGGVAPAELETRLAAIHERVERLADHVHRRQELDWAASALGTDLATLEAMAMDPEDDAGRRGDASLQFPLTALVALGLEPERTMGPWSLDRLLELRGVALEDFQRRPIREQVVFHEVLGPLDPDAARGIAVAATTLGFGDVVRLSDPHVRVRPWSDVPVTVEVDRSMLPGPLRADDVRRVTLDDLGDQFVGSMYPVWREDHERRPFDPFEDRGGYRERDDWVGRTGIEAMEESRLRGERGLRRDRVRLSISDDPAADPEADPGADPGAAAREPDHIPRVDGQDVHTTIDIRLQARISAALHPDIGFTLADPAIHGTSGLAGVEHAIGHPLEVGVAVLDVATGDVIALVNGPTREQLPDPDMQPILRDAEGWLDRDIAGRWGTTPGSTIKPLILTAAISDGLRTARDTETCNGHFFESPTWGARCWIYRAPVFATHGPIDGPHAIAQSCNIFFHHVADSYLGREERLVRWLDHFGLGRRPGGLPVFGAGTRPMVESIAGMRGPARFERIMVGTGQAAMTWTPLQAAAAFASFFRAGDMPVPQLMADRDAGAGPAAGAGADPRADAGSPAPPPADEPPCVPSPDAIAAVHEGLYRGVTWHRGTAHHINLATGQHRIFTPDARSSGALVGGEYTSVAVWGKTGTAQEVVSLRRPAVAPVLPPEPGEDLPTLTAEAAPAPTHETRTLSHGWFVGVVAADEFTPGAQGEYAIAVVVRWGGSGGYTAGPIANQVILALMQEGYLPMEPGLRRTEVIRERPGTSTAPDDAIAAVPAPPTEARRR